MSRGSIERIFFTFVENLRNLSSEKRKNLRNGPTECSEFSEFAGFGGAASKGPDHLGHRTG